MRFVDSGHVQSTSAPGEGENGASAGGGGGEDSQQLWPVASPAVLRGLYRAHDAPRLSVSALAPVTKGTGAACDPSPSAPARAAGLPSGSVSPPGGAMSSPPMWPVDKLFGPGGRTPSTSASVSDGPAEQAQGPGGYGTGLSSGEKGPRHYGGGGVELSGVVEHRTGLWPR